MSKILAVFAAIANHFRREPARYLGLALSGAAIAVGVIKHIDPAVVVGQCVFYIGLAEKLRSVVTPVVKLVSPSAAAVLDDAGNVAEQVAADLPAQVEQMSRTLAGLQQTVAGMTEAKAGSAQ